MGIHIHLVKIGYSARDTTDGADRTQDRLDDEGRIRLLICFGARVVVELKMVVVELDVLV